MCAPQVTRHTSIRYSSSCHTHVNRGTFCMHRHPVSVNCLYHAWMVLSVGGSYAHFARNTRCTVTTDLLVWYSNTQNDFSPELPFSHCIHLQRLAAEMWTTEKNNLLVASGRGGGGELSCSFYLYRFLKNVSYGFPIIHFCNPGVHYETPCLLNPHIYHYLPTACFGVCYTIFRVITAVLAQKLDACVQGCCIVDAVTCKTYCLHTHIYML